MSAWSTDRELLWLAGLGGLLLALIAGVEGAGLLGGVLASGHPVLLSLPGAARTLTQLPRHFGALAWPAADRRWLAGSIGVGLVFGACVTVALAAALVWTIGWLIGAHGAGEGAWFAGGRELRPLWVRRGARRGIALGSHHGHELAGEPNASVALCGPSQSGKSLATVARAILTWHGCLIVLSTKQDLLRYTLHAREQRGEVKIFDPTGLSGYRTNTWSPVSASRTWTQARAIADGLLKTGLDAERDGRGPQPSGAAARYLASLLLAAGVSGQSMRTILSWVDLRERDEPREILEGASDAEARYALDNLEALWSAEGRTREPAIALLSSALDAWRERSVVAATADPEITPQWLCEGPNTLYILAPAGRRRPLQNLFGGLLAQLIDGALDSAQQAPGGRLEPSLLCALDEVCDAAPLPALGEYASSGAGQGVLLLSVIRDYAQAINTWGRDRAATIVSSHRGKLFWSGIADPATFEYIDRLLGEEQRERQSRTRQSSGASSTTNAAEFRPLAPPHRLRQAQFGTALLVYGQLPPAWTEQRLFSEDRELRKLVPEELRAGIPSDSEPRSRSGRWRWANAR